jgi:predicted NAD-dependent protein-ADP-ribosyltransferase YbiA (DUF1768 family)
MKKGYVGATIVTNSDMVYDRSEAIIFHKTREAYGGLSNMAGGYPLLVEGVRILTSEALYQACRFPHLIEVQQLIIAQASPMAAKMKSKPYRAQSRQEWDAVRVDIMRWCLKIKLAQHRIQFGNLLLSTGEKAMPSSPTVPNIAHRKHAAAMPPTNWAAIYPGTRFHGKLRRAANANVTAGFRCAPPTAPMKYMMAMTIMPGAATFILSVIVPPLSAPTTPAPAATTTSRNVPQTSEKSRRHSWADSKKSSGAEPRSMRCSSVDSVCSADIIIDSLSSDDFAGNHGVLVKFVNRAEPAITVGDNQLAASFVPVQQQWRQIFIAGDLNAIFFHMAIADPK